MIALSVGEHRFDADLPSVAVVGACADATTVVHDAGAAFQAFAGVRARITDLSVQGERAAGIIAVGAEVHVERVRIEGLRFKEGVSGASAVDGGRVSLRWVEIDDIEGVGINANEGDVVAEDLVIRNVVAMRSGERRGDFGQGVQVTAAPGSS